MNHQDAIRESSLERYILGELSAQPRDLFEEHLFECELCAADLKSSVMFLEAARNELPAMALARPDQSQAEDRVDWLGRRPRRLAWLLSPTWLVPALAASLTIAGYQAAVLLPAARLEVAQANAPAILNTVMLGTGASRGDGLREIHAPSQGTFLIQFDIPTQDDFTSYRCTLYSPSESLVWQGTVTPEQARNTLSLRVPASSATPGINHLVVEGMHRQDPSGVTFVKLSQYQFLLQLEK